MEQAAGEGGGAGSSSGGGSGGPSGEVEVPDEYLCPITSEIMTDPVVTVRFTALAPHTRCSPPRLLWWQADGFTYERAAIAKWLEDHDTSPKTGARLEFKALFPNQSLRAIIREFQEAQAQAQEAQAQAQEAQAQASQAQTAAVQQHQQPAWAVFLEPQAPPPPEASTAAAGGSSGVPTERGGRGGRVGSGDGVGGELSAA